MVIQRTPTKIDKIVSLRIGQHQENAATQIKMDVSDWITVHPTAGFHILFKRPGEVQAQPVLSSLEEGILTWTVQEWETSLIGVGYAEVRAIEAESALVAKSRVIPCSIEESVIEDGEVPPAYSGWVEQVLSYKDDAEAAQEAAETAQGLAEGAKDVAVAAQQASAASQTAAAGSAADALAYMNAAASHATAAEGHSSQAQTYKNATAVSAQDASDSADVAQGYASTASLKAGEAAESATAAAGSAQDASTAKTAAQSAETNATRSAQDAQAARTAAEESATQAAASAQSAIVKATEAAASAQEAQNVLDSIPPDYSALAGEVSHLSSTLEFVTPEMFGAKGDGETDDTAAVQNAINAGSAILFTGNYLVDNVRITKSDCILFGKGSIIKIPTSDGAYELLRLLGDNIRIIGLTLQGDRDEHTGETGEHGICLKIDGKNAFIENCIITKGWGDGVYINADGCTINNCIIDHNRRNGISVINSQGFRITNCTISRTDGTSPKYAIDIEPNTTTDQISGEISNIFTHDNVGGSIFLSLQNSGTNTVAVSIDGVHSVNDCSSHTNNYGTFGVFTNSGVKLQASFDHIDVQNSVFHILGVNVQYQTTEDVRVKFSCTARNHVYQDVFILTNASSKKLLVDASVYLMDYTVTGIVTGAGTGSKTLILNSNLDMNYPNISSAKVEIYLNGTRKIDVSSRIRSGQNIEVVGECYRVDNGLSHFYHLEISFPTTTSSNFYFYVDKYIPIGAATLSAICESTEIDTGAFINSDGLMLMNSIPTAGKYIITGLVNSQQA